MAELSPSIGVLAKGIYYLIVLFPYSEAKVLPFPCLLALAVAEIDLPALKDSQRDLFAV